MATYAEILDLGMSRLGKRSSTTLRADLLLELQSTVDEPNNGEFLPWFLETSGVVSISSSTGVGALPSIFLREAEDVKPYYTADDGTRKYLHKRLYGELLGAEDETSPKYYSIYQSSMYVRAYPESNLIVNLSYYSNDSATGSIITDSGTDADGHLWLFHAKNWVLNQACSMVAGEILGNQKKAQSLMARAMATKAQVYKFHEARIHQNQDYSMGGATNSES